MSSRSGESVSPTSVFSIWAALIALWALPYLSVLTYLRVDAAQSEALQWLLVAIGAFGIGSLLYLAWRHSRDPNWRAARGLARLQR